MMIVWSMFGYLLLIGGVIVVHELGHLGACLLTRVAVDRFSIGFGKPLYRRPVRAFGELTLGMLPLGGYVRFATDNPRPGTQLFSQASGLQRLAIILAGPAVNLALGIVLITATAAGRAGYQAPIVYDVVPDSPLAQAGVRAGDRIVSVGGRKVDDLRLATLPMIRAALLERPVVWSLQRDQQQIDITLPPPPLNLRSNPVEAAGLSVFDLQAPARPRVVFMSLPGFGISAGDRITAIDDRPIATDADLRRAMKGRAGHLTRVTYETSSGARTDIVKPLRRGDSDDGLLGLQMDLPVLVQTVEDGIDRPALAALGIATARAMDLTVITAASLVRLVSGDLDVSTLAGPVQIAQASGVAVRGVVREAAWTNLIEFLAALSIAIGVMNLLPIPIVDGGQAVLTLIEIVRRRPLSPRFMQAVQSAGVLILGVMFLAAAYSDFLSVSSK